MRASRPVLFLALVALLAGCAAPAATPDTINPASLAGPKVGLDGVVHALGGATLAPDAATGMIPARGLQLHMPGFGGGEPTMGVDAKGVLFAEAFAGSQPTILRSQDHGVTWKDVGPLLPGGQHAPPLTFDPYMYLDPATGRVFKNENDLECAFLSWSDDQGATWTSSPAGCALGTGLADHQSMVAAKPRVLPVSPLYPRIVYSCTNTGATTECGTSLNGGYTFGPVVQVFPGPTPGSDTATSCVGGILGHPVSDAEGRVFLAHAGCGGGPEIGVTEDDGLTWAIHTITHDPMIDATVVHDVNLAVDANGTVYAGWISAGGLPTYAWSGDHGVHWSLPRVVSPQEVTAAAWPALAAGEDGRLVFAYIGTTIEGGYAGKDVGGDGTVLSTTPISDPPEWANASWNGYLTVLTDAKAESPVATTVTTNDPADPLARGVCGKTRCSGMDDFIDAVIDPEGRPYAVFVDVCNDKCVADPTIHKAGNVLSVGTLAQGPALRGPLAPLSVLAPPATPK